MSDSSERSYLDNREILQRFINSVRGECMQAQRQESLVEQGGLI